MSRRTSRVKVPTFRVGARSTTSSLTRLTSSTGGSPSSRGPSKLKEETSKGVTGEGIVLVHNKRGMCYFNIQIFEDFTLLKVRTFRV